MFRADFLWQGVIEWDPAFKGSNKWVYRIEFSEDFAGIVGAPAVHIRRVQLTSVIKRSQQGVQLARLSVSAIRLQVVRSFGISPILNRHGRLRSWLRGSTTGNIISRTFDGCLRQVPYLGLSSFKDWGLVYHSLSAFIIELCTLIVTIHSILFKGFGSTIQ